MRSRVLFIGFLTLTIILIFIRFSVLGDAEPRADQGSIIVWIQDLRQSLRFWPVDHADAGFVEKLITDEHSFLNILIRRIYLAQDHIFVLLSVAWFYLLSFPLGVSAEAQILASIIAGTLALSVFAVIPLSFRGRMEHKFSTETAWITVAAFILLAASSYLYLYSVIGIHNVGLLGFAISIVITQLWLSGISMAPPETRRQVDIRALVLLLLGQSLAIYAHYTTVFLLAPATFASLLFIRHVEASFRKRIVFFYVAGVIVIFLPAVVWGVISASLGPHHGDQGFATRLIWVLTQEGYSAAELLRRVMRWGHVVSGSLSWPIVFAGVVGVIGIARRLGNAFLFFLVGIHFLVGILMPGFNQYDRTGAYVLPILIVGAAWLFVVASNAAISAWRSDRPSVWFRYAVPTGVVMAIVLHGFFEIARFSNDVTILHWGTVIQRHVGVRRMAKDFHKKLPQGSVVVPWNYKVSHMFKMFRDDTPNSPYYLRTLVSLHRELKNNNIQQYLKRRGIRIPEGTPVYILAPEKFELGIPVSDVAQEIARAGFGWQAPMSVDQIQQMKLPAWLSLGQHMTVYALR